MEQVVDLKGNSQWVSNQYPKETKEEEKKRLWFQDHYPRFYDGGVDHSQHLCEQDQRPMGCILGMKYKVTC